MVLSCDNKSYESMRHDYEVLKRPIDVYKYLGGRVPIGLSTALYGVEEAFRTGQNMDKALKSACQEMEGFFAATEEVCARQAGFSSAAELKRSTDSGVGEQFSICTSTTDRKYLLKAVVVVLNVGDPKSFVSVFTQETKEQVRGVIKKVIGDGVKAVFYPRKKK